MIVSKVLAYRRTIPNFHIKDESITRKERKEVDVDVYEEKEAVTREEEVGTAVGHDKRRM